MKRIKTGSGIKGNAKIRIKGDKISLAFESGETISLVRDQAPRVIRPGNYFVNMNSNGDQVLGVRPVFGTFKAKFKNFVSRNDEPPSPIQKPGGIGHRKDGTTFPYDPYLAFTAILEIVDGEEKGMTVPIFLRYLFVSDEDGGSVVKGGGENADLLEAFLESAGVFDDVIPFSDNILPKLQKRLLKKAQPFLISMVKGNVKAFQEIPDDADDDDDLDEDALPTSVDDEEGDPPWNEDDDD